MKINQFRKRGDPQGHPGGRCAFLRRKGDLYPQHGFVEAVISGTRCGFEVRARRSVRGRSRGRHRCRRGWRGAPIVPRTGKGSQKNCRPGRKLFGYIALVYKWGSQIGYCKTTEEEVGRNGKIEERAEDQFFQAGRLFTVQEHKNESYEPPCAASRRTE